MDWFQRLTGFVEENYGATKSKLAVVDGNLRSSVNGKTYAIGKFEFASLKDLRERASKISPRGRLKVRNVSGDVRRLHQSSEYKGALFQVASQFNCLEMTSPGITPEHGVTRYQNDRTQGPACAIAAGAATIYRNYFVPVGDGQIGQTQQRQLDGLAPMGRALSRTLERPVESLWHMSNGYAMCTDSGLGAIGMHLLGASDDETDAFRDLLVIGLHRDVQVTEGEAKEQQHVSQAFCSALPVAYSSITDVKWQPFAELVLEGAYEATLWAELLNVQRGRSNVVLLTRLGGGAFGNADVWIDRAMRRAFERLREYPLDVRVVSYGEPIASMVEMEKTFS